MVHLPGARVSPTFKPRWKKPSPAKMIKAWPPVGYAEKKNVNKKTGENFWTVAREFDRGNPWDIIIFNFGTEDPEEVNWYLHHAVGCSHREGFEGNFCFYPSVLADGSDGIIYIPPASWRPPASFQKGSSAGKLLPGIRATVSAILTRLSARMPDITIGNTYMSSSGFAKVAELINTEQVRVQIDPSLRGANGEYNPFFRTITLKKTPSLNSVSATKTLANEATHVYSHWRSISGDSFKHELASSLVGTIAAASINLDWVRKKLKPGNEPELYFAAWVWADQLAGLTSIRQTDLDRLFWHPEFKRDENPYRLLESYHSRFYSHTIGSDFDYFWDLKDAPLP